MDLDLKTSNSISISVIIPCYNSESTISRCLESIFYQTELPDEIIIIDDNSNDKTLSEIELSKEKSPIKIKTLKNDENKGPGYCRNKGWEAAESAYIAFLDSDDIWVKDKIKIQKKLLPELNYPEILGATCNLKKKYTNKINKVSISQLLWKNPFCTSTILLKRAINQRFENNYYSEDFMLWAKIISENNSSHCQDILLAKPIDKRGLSGNNTKMYKGEIGVIKFISSKKSRFLFLPSYLWITLKFIKRALGF